MLGSERNFRSVNDLARTVADYWDQSDLYVLASVHPFEDTRAIRRFYDLSLSSMRVYL